MKKLLTATLLAISLASTGCVTAVAVRPPRPGMVYVEGRWVFPPRADAVWVPAHWERRGAFHRVWIGGYWR